MADEDDSIQVDVEKEARELGWVSQEEFRGNKDRWVPAEEFIEKAQHVLPLMKANNRRLKQELLTRDQKIDTLTQQLQNASAAIERLDKHYSEAAKRQVAEAKAGLLKQLKEARQDDDVEKEEDIQTKLAELREAELRGEDKTTKKPTTTPASDKVDEEFLEWKTENPWFDVDKKKTKAIVRIAEDLREEGNRLQGKAFYDACLAELNRQQGNNDSDDDTPVSRVASSTRRSDSRVAKSFADLPRDAQQACYEDADTLVGPNKRFKTLEEWKKEYTRIYLGLE